MNSMLKCSTSKATSHKYEANNKVVQKNVILNFWRDKYDFNKVKVKNTKSTESKQQENILTTQGNDFRINWMIHQISKWNIRCKETQHEFK